MACFLLAGCVQDPEEEQELVTILGIEVSSGFPAEKALPLNASGGLPLRVQQAGSTWDGPRGALLFEDPVFGSVRLHRSIEDAIYYRITLREDTCAGNLVVRGEVRPFRVGVAGELSSAYQEVAIHADAPCEASFTMRFLGPGPVESPT